MFVIIIMRLWLCEMDVGVGGLFGFFFVFVERHNKKNGPRQRTKKPTKSGQRPLVISDCLAWTQKSGSLIFMRDRSNHTGSTIQVAMCPIFLTQVIWQT
mmetsp:Transcript_18526/g.33524  ORF Transcript_18526/g.33524 Transcript_18526/m.33524 type:complete len:99 (+) Transcript_18526:1041-1337(+)